VIYRALALGATYEIAILLDSAVVKSVGNGFGAEEAEGLVLSLQQRCRNFPPVLRQPHTGEESNERQVTIGNMHISGAYYFSVILVTRQFLIQSIVPQLSVQEQASQEQRRCIQHDPAEKARVEQLADACIEAAGFMAEMCHQVMRCGQLMGNMCIVK
jgi:hypothetical protein